MLAQATKSRYLPIAPVTNSDRWHYWEIPFDTMSEFLVKENEDTLIFILYYSGYGYWWYWNIISIASETACSSRYFPVFFIPSVVYRSVYSQSPLGPLLIDLQAIIYMFVPFLRNSAS